MTKTINHPYVPTPIQAELHSDPHRFKVACFGRRSGKSTWAFNEAQQVCWEKPGSKVWIVCPTFAQAKDIYWRGRDIMGKYLIQDTYIKKNDSELLIEYPRDSILQLKGSDRNETLVGSGLDLIVNDEVAKHRNFTETWEKMLLPSLSDKNGKAVFISTPEGYNHFYDLYLKGQGKLPDWKSWRIPTWNSGAPWTETEKGREELIRLEAEITEDAFMQEYGADFRKHTGLVFKEFSREVHVKPFDVDEKYYLECGMDFGWTNPTTCIYSYFDDDDTWWIFDEYAATERSIEDHAGRILAIRNKYKNRNRFVVGDSEAQQSINEFNNLFSPVQFGITPIEKTKKSVLKGISRMQNRFKINPVTKLPTVFIHPRCENFIRELERYRWKEKKQEDINEPDVPEKAFDHTVDAARYIILHHVKRNKELAEAGGVASYSKPYNIYER